MISQGSRSPEHLILGALVILSVAIGAGCARDSLLDPSTELGADSLGPALLGVHPFLETLEKQVQPDVVLFLGQVQQGGVNTQGQKLGGGVKPLIEAIEG